MTPNSDRCSELSSGGFYHTLVSKLGAFSSVMIFFSKSQICANSRKTIDMS